MIDTILTSIRLPVDIAALLMRIARECDMSKAAIIRQAIREFASARGISLKSKTP